MSNQIPTEIPDGPEQTDARDEGVLVRKPDGAKSGIWVGHFGNDPESDALEIQNVWGKKRRTNATIPKDAVADVIAALEERV